jgi:hypothetical protein
LAGVCLLFSGVWPNLDIAIAVRAVVINNLFISLKNLNSKISYFILLNRLQGQSYDNILNLPTGFRARAGQMHLNINY